MYLKCVALEYVDYVKYLGVMISNDMKDDADMNRHLRSFYSRSNVIFRKFHHCASNMFVNNRVENYDAHNRHLIYSLRSRLLDSDSQIVACLNVCLYIRGRYMWTSWRESLYI